MGPLHGVDGHFVFAPPPAGTVSFCLLRAGDRQNCRRGIEPNKRPRLVRHSIAKHDATDL
jgi:hypothetical protein